MMSEPLFEKIADAVKKFLNYFSPKPANKPTKDPLKQAQAKQFLGLASIAGAVPMCALSGLSRALPMLGFGLYQLYKSREQEQNPSKAAKSKQKMSPRHYPRVPFLRRPRLY